MKIAIIGSFYTKIPLKESVIHTPLMLTYNLAIQLSKMGHDITYFGRVDDREKMKNSKLKYNDLFYVGATDQIRKATSSAVWQNFKIIYEQSHVAEVLKMKDFDIFYTWEGFLAGPLAKLTDKLVILTHHDSTSMKAYNMIFNSFKGDNIFLIPISKYMKKIMTFPGTRTLGVVHHGIKIQESIQTITPEDSFCWVGRVTPSKGLHTAIRVAQRAGEKLKIIGPMKDSFADSGNVENYNRIIKREISQSDDIRYLGTMTQAQTRKEIATSKGLIFPLEGTESFALIVIEAITAGVPVIATNKEPLNEIIDHGKTGFLCNTIEEMSEAVRGISSIDRKICREIGKTRFSLKTMAKGYEREFRKALQMFGGRA